MKAKALLTTALLLLSLHFVANGQTDSASYNNDSIEEALVFLTPDYEQLGKITEETETRL